MWLPKPFLCDLSNIFFHILERSFSLNWNKCETFKYIRGIVVRRAKSSLEMPCCEWNRFQSIFGKNNNFELSTPSVFASQYDRIQNLKKCRGGWVKTSLISSLLAPLFFRFVHKVHLWIGVRKWLKFMSKFHEPLYNLSWAFNSFSV